MSTKNKIDLIKDPDFPTHLFSPAANTFKEKGFYTDTIKGTKAYRNFWNEEIQRCHNGYKVLNHYITGRHYFYLNYCPIELIEEVEVMYRGKKTKREMRITSFPRFYDYDKVFFDGFEDAINIGENFCVLKARGKGYSYKNAANALWNYYFERGSTTFIIAAESEFLIKNGIITKAWSMMDWIDANTAWGKKRQVKDTIMHRKASYKQMVNGILVEKGYKSEIIGVTGKNDVQKIRGKRGYFYIEEGGKFPNLIEAVSIIESGVRLGTKSFGFICLFGTGGTEDANFQGLKEIFFHPKAYQMYQYDDIWDSAATKPCGFFVPEYMNLEGFIYPNGVSMVDKAIEYCKKQREIKVEEAGSSEAIDRYIAEHPFTPLEACMQLHGNIFPQAKLMEQKHYVELNQEVLNKGQIGELDFIDTGKVVWKINSRRRFIPEFPTPKDFNLDAGICIWEHPFIDEETGIIPRDMYIAGIDPYDHDQSGTTSLGSCYIYKRFYKPDIEFDIVVAEYTARPSTADEWYENTRKLLLYYGILGTALFENNIIGLLKYFSHMRSEHLLADEPDTKTVIANSRVKRRKGVHMSKEMITYSEKLIQKELLLFDGKKYGYQKIYSIPLLQELIDYNSIGNFDRVRALGCALIQKEQMFERNVRIDKVNTSFFPKKIFVSEPTRDWIL